MRIRSLRSIALAVPLLLLSALPVDAGGFAVFEQGARGMGFAGAFTAQASDPSAIFHNAAGIVFLKGSQLYVGGTLIRPSSTFEGADPFPGSAARGEGDSGLTSLPTLYYTRGIGDRLAVGVGLHTPFALENAWAEPDTWSGRFLSRSAHLRSVSLNPTVAYKLADRLSVGGGLDLRFTSMELSRNVGVVNPFTQKVVNGALATFTGDRDTSVGFNLGILGRLDEEWSVGLSYRHKVNAELGGTGNFRQVGTGDPGLDALVATTLPAGTVDLVTELELPAVLSGGVAWQRSQWLFELDVNWIQWDAFDVVGMRFEARPDLSQVIEQHYTNAWQARVGAERAIDDAWTARGGYFFDQAAAPDASISPLLADGHRHGLALGGTWSSGSLRVDAATSFVLMQKRSSEGAGREGFDGSYGSRAITLAVSLGYAF